MGTPKAVIFDVGRVLVEWDPRYLYERLIDDDQALEAFLANVVTKEWHFQHDAGRPFAETSAELIALHPEHAELIGAWGPRFGETIPHAVPGMFELVRELDAAGVPLYAITNFSGEFWREWVPQYAELFDRFRDIVVSGDEKLVKPDPAIYALALKRFGLEGPDAVFVDDSPANVEGANAAGIHGVLFTNAEDFRAELVHLGLLSN
ncbi:HAD family phosphatase [Sphingomonas psychrotolerans]|uniref:HAD family phosphatase n=1 Tax=Sphingomonas psychrotolerans TaxID=1327635 RepID=A0ABU3N7W7_9SPHN|nr:HAD family phosphatase [Sphingomonas psychrotolerans]MDT8759887.1 HAD family phosphatase [Sphingomonas psychrotolerans]